MEKKQFEVGWACGASFGVLVGAGLATSGDWTLAFQVGLAMFIANVAFFLGVRLLRA